MPLAEPSGLGWLDGFDELLVRCGLESNGAPEFDATTGRLQHPLHGRIANKPAHTCQVTFDPESREIAVTGVVEETRFLITKLRLTTTITTKLGELETKDDIKRRIDEAAKFAPLDQLALSPQCGFASTVHGNDISIEQQAAKIRLVIEVAEEVWG